MGITAKTWKIYLGLLLISIANIAISNTFDLECLDSVYKQQLIDKSKELVASQKTHLERLLPTTSYQSYTHFIDDILANESELGPSVSMILQDKFLLSSEQSSSLRGSIAEHGFLNQYQTHTTGGGPYPQVRNMAEAALMHVDYHSYKDTSSYLKPKYGLIHPEATGENELVKTQYGDDIYIFDKNKMKSRTTWTLGDSLNRYLKYRGMNMPGSSTYELNTWDKIFIPIEYKELMIPFIADSLKTKKNISMNNYNFNNISEAVKPTVGWEQAHAEYIEVQMWGPLDLSMVSGFVFRRDVPSQEFIDVLKQHNIKIYDGRSGKLVEVTD